jgi:hypothetical protein
MHPAGLEISFLSFIFSLHPAFSFFIFSLLLLKSQQPRIKLLLNKKCLPATILFYHSFPNACIFSVPHLPGHL